MVGETKMSSQNGKTQFPPQSVAHDVGEFAHDVVTLAELQTELLKVDLEDCVKRMILPIVLFSLALVVVLGSIPIALTAFACLLVAAGLSYGVAFLLTALLGVFCAVGLGFLGWKGVSSMSKSFDRSRSEFSRNLRWVKRMLTSKRRTQHRTSSN